MTPAQIRLVRETWAAATRDPNAAADRFHTRLFALEPELRLLLGRAARAPHRRALIEAAGRLIAALDRPAELEAAVEALGRHHAALGVEDHHYTAVGRAVIETLRQMLGDDFTPDVEAAWVDAYWLLARMMWRVGRPALAA